MFEIISDSITGPSNPGSLMLAKFIRAEEGKGHHGIRRGQEPRTVGSSRAGDSLISSWVLDFSNRPWQPKCWRPWESTLPTTETLDLQPLTCSTSGNQTETPSPNPRPGFASPAPDCYDVESGEWGERRKRREQKSGPRNSGFGEGQVGRVSIRGCRQQENWP